jgi:hypothetical protein
MSTSTASTKTDPPACSEKGFTEVSVNARTFFEAVVSNTDQEEYSRTCFFAVREERLRCGHGVPLSEDPCQHPEEACPHRSGEEIRPEDIMAPHRRDEAKVFRLPEPRRASQWLRMFYVACNGSFVRFENLYENYCFCCDPLSLEASLKTPATPLDSPMPKEKEQTEQESQPQELCLEEEDVQEPQAPKENPQSTNAEHRPTQPTAAPLLSRAEFLQVLSDTFHGMRVYNPGGRVHSWSSNKSQCRACSKYIITGICFRAAPLTFGSTQRKKNLRRLK